MNGQQVTCLQFVFVFFVFFVANRNSLQFQLLGQSPDDLVGLFR
jgi:hypothetical protein